MLEASASVEAELARLIILQRLMEAVSVDNAAYD
jgi:hypothetical protein